MYREPLSKEGRKNIWWVVAPGLITLLAFALRVYHLDMQSLWADEGYSVYLAGQSLPVIFTDIVSDHSPLYYVILHAWMLAAGQSEFAVRFVSVCGGLLVVALTYAAGRRLLGRPAGLVAAFLTAIAPLHVYYAQEARMHILVTALGLASAYFMPRFMDLSTGPSSRVRGFVAYALVTAAGLWTFYYFALLILAQNVYVAYRVLRDLYRRRSPIPLARRWLASQLAVALLFTPWAVYAAPRVLESFRMRAPAFGFASLDLLPALRLCLETFSVGPTVDPASALALSLPLVALAVVGSLAPRVRDRGLLVCWLGVPVLTAWLVNLRFPPFLPRYLLAATPAYYLLAAAGLIALLSGTTHFTFRVSRFAFRVLRFTLPAGLLLLTTFTATLSLHNNYHDPTYARDDYRGVAATIRRHSAADEALVLNAWWQASMFDYYDPGLLTQYGVPEQGQLPDRAHTEAAIAAVAERHPAIWLCLYGSAAGDPDNAVGNWLDRHCARVWDEWFGQVRLLRYLTPGSESDAPAHPVGSKHDGLVLLGLSPAHATVEAGANVPINLYWQAEGRIRADYSASLRLVDLEGRVWSRQDGAPLGGLYPTSTWPVGERVRDRRLLPVPGGTPPGEYTVDWHIYVSGASDRPPDNVPPPLRVIVVRPARAPGSEDLLLDRSAEVDFDGVRLRGAWLSNPTARAGDPFQVDLLWERTGSVPAGLRAIVELRDAAGTPVVESAVPLGDRYAPADWRPGESVREMHPFLIPADVRDGEYRLWVTLHRPDGSPMPVRWWLGLPVADGVDLGPVLVVGRPHSFDVPPTEHPLSAQLGDGVRLLGYDLKPADGSRIPRAGVNLHVTLYWQCVQPLDTSYTVFCHLVDANGTLGPQQDDLPCLGQCPTTSWVPDEVLTDEHTIVLPADMASGPYTLLVGMYDAQTMQRLPVAGGGDAVLAGTVDITPAR